MDGSRIRNENVAFTNETDTCGRALRPDDLMFEETEFRYENTAAW